MFLIADYKDGKNFPCLLPFSNIKGASFKHVSFKS
jgi:hypothetical protein